MLFIVVKSEQKNSIMRAIMEKAGLESKAQSIVFSLPVTDTAGMRLMEEMGETLQTAYPDPGSSSWTCSGYWQPVQWC